MTEQVTAWLSAAGAVIAGLGALWGVVSAASRPARLRREEAQWRGLLDAGTTPTGGRRLVEDLHRHVSAQLVSLRLRPPSMPFMRAMTLLVGALFAVMLGVLGSAMVVDGAGELGPLAWGLFGALLVGAPTVVGGALVPMTEEANARNAIAGRLLADDLPIRALAPGVGIVARFRHYTQGDLRYLRTKMVALSCAATTVPVGVAVAGTAAWVPLVAPLQSDMAGRVSAVGIVTYGFGLAMLGAAWRALVQPPPDLQSPAYQRDEQSLTPSSPTPTASPARPRMTLPARALDLLAIAVLCRHRGTR